jgi:hypothetical protein
VAFPFQFRPVNRETAVDIAVMVARDESTWTWLHSSSSRPVRLEPGEWPDGLAKSVDVRNQARDGAAKGRVLIIRHGPVLREQELAPVAVMCWHAHGGNWPLCVLDCGYRRGMDDAQGAFIVEQYLFGALADLNDRLQFRDRKVPRPTDRLGWAIRRQDGAGSDPAWGRTVAARAQGWGFAVVRPKSARPTWARDGFYGERPR